FFLFSLLLYWFPRLQISLIYIGTSLSNCTHLAIYGKDQSLIIVSLEEESLPNISLSHLKKFYVRNSANEKIKLFEYKLYKYIFNPDKKTFSSLKCILNSSFKNIHHYFLNGLSLKEVEYQRKLF